MLDGGEALRQLSLVQGIDAFICTYDYAQAADGSCVCTLIRERLTSRQPFSSERHDDEGRRLPFELLAPAHHLNSRLRERHCLEQRQRNAKLPPRRLEVHVERTGIHDHR